MRGWLTFLFLFSVVSCKSTPKKTTDISKKQTPVVERDINNVNIAFIKSQLMSLDSQIWGMDEALTTARARLNSYKSLDIPGKDAMVTEVKSEITEYQTKREGLKAQKTGLEMQLMLNQ